MSRGISLLNSGGSDPPGWTSLRVPLTCPVRGTSLHQVLQSESEWACELVAGFKNERGRNQKLHPCSFLLATVMRVGLSRGADAY